MSRRVEWRPERARTGPAIVALALVAAACGTGTAPRLAIEEQAADGRGGAHYLLRNVGGDDLLVHAVGVDCGCRLAAPLPDVLAPGETTALALACRPLAPATTSRTVRIFSNDAEVEERRVALTLPPASAAPGTLWLGHVRVGESGAREVTLPAGAVGTPHVSDPALTVTARPERPDGRHVYEVRFSPRRAGVVTSTLALGAGGAVPVLGVGVGDVAAFPAVADLEPGGPPVEIALRRVGPTPRTLAAPVLPPGVAGELRTVTAGSDWILSVRAAAPAAEADTADAAVAPPVIRIPGAAAGDGALEIPVQGLRREPRS